MSKTLNLRILRIDEPLYHGEAVLVSLQSGNGMISILPDHAPLISSIDPCTIRVETEQGGEHLFEANGGIVEVVQNTCTVLL